MLKLQLNIQFKRSMIKNLGNNVFILVLQINQKKNTLIKKKNMGDT